MAECALAIADRLLGNEPVRRGDLRTQNGILRQVSLVAHCQFSPIAVEPPSTLLQDRHVRARAGWLRLSYERRDSASPGVSRGKYFFLVPSRNLGCQAVITMALLFSRPPKEVEEGQHAENYGCGSCGSLPQTHQRYLFEEIEKLCRSYLENRRVPASEMSPKELVSEIWAKAPWNEIPG